MTEEIIERFFRKECTAAEAMQVSAYLKGHPEVLNRYVSKTEWDNAGENAGKSKEYWEEIWAGIRKKSATKAIVILMKQSAVAAAVAGLLFISYNLTVSNHANKLSTAQPVQSTLPQSRIEINTTSKKRLVLLEDGSKVTLSPSSFIEYNSPFTNNKRDIILKGEAYFTVAKDKNRPFTVFAANLSTTALGTEFKITTRANKQDITVKLFKGKVLIKSTKPALEGWSKNIYLLPGEQIQYNADRKLVSVGKIETSTNQQSVAKLGVPLKKKQQVSVDVLSFSSTALQEVMDKLSAHYRYKIVYNAEELSGMNFTGNITKTDSLAVILKVITQMNHLEMLQKDDQILIYKPKGLQDEK